MHRQIILDTETTGLRVEEGHKIIEIGCLEMLGRKLTGKHFHEYINPNREIDAGALAVHGISNDFLKSKPTFEVIAEEFINFIKDAELIIHNASFDISFINNELALISKKMGSIADYCHVIDTLQMARQIHVGQRNSLDALCKRYSIDLSKREYHGALLDAHLLSQVYLAMTGGQGSFFDGIDQQQASETSKEISASKNENVGKYNLIVKKANQDELAAHENYLQTMKQLGKCIWLDDLLTS